MDLKQLEYILKIAEENNITHAAEKLFITQSALNQQLLKLEKELGTELFHRSRTDWHPTLAGDIYISAAKEILHIKEDTYNRIYDLEHRNKGKLSIGFTPNRGTAMFSSIYPTFHEKHPQVIVEPLELSVTEQLARIGTHTLNVGFLTLPSGQRKTGFSYNPIETEEIFLAVPASHDYSDLVTSDSSGLTPSSINKNGNSYPVLSLDKVKDESFVLLYKQSTLRPLFDTLFHHAGFKPNILFETASTYTILNMIEANLCCGLIPAYYIDTQNTKIRYYALPCHPTCEVVSCWSSDSYLSEAGKDFIELTKGYWNS